MCVSPLNTLMIDQTKKFSAMGIRTNYVRESQSDCTTIHSVIRGDVQLVFISPESIVYNTVFRNMLLSQTYKKKLVALSIDEAHCLKTW